MTRSLRPGPRCAESRSVHLTRGRSVVYSWSAKLFRLERIAPVEEHTVPHQVVRRERPTRIELASSAWKVGQADFDELR